MGWSWIAQLQKFSYCATSITLLLLKVHCKFTQPALPFICHSLPTLSFHHPQSRRCITGFFFSLLNLKIKNSHDGSRERREKEKEREKRTNFAGFPRKITIEKKGFWFFIVYEVFSLSIRVFLLGHKTCLWRLIIYVKSLTSNLSRCFNFIIWKLKILKGLQSSFQLGIIIISRIILIWFQKNKEQKKKKII